MAPEPVTVLVDHAAPMLLRAGRGGKLGLFAVRQATEATVRGVAPDELAEPRGVIPAGVPDDVRRYDGALWTRVDLITAQGTFAPAPLADALRYLSVPPSRREADGLPRIVGLEDPPFGSRVEGPLRSAKAYEARDAVPAEARDLVDPARSAASAAMLDHVARGLLHDGTHLYRRLPVPLMDPTDPSRASCRVMSGYHYPLVSHRRVGADGSSPAHGKVGFLPGLAERVGRFLEGVDDADADIDRFLAAVPVAILPILREIGTPVGEGHLERIWPLALAAERAETPSCGREEAVEIIRAAADAVLFGHEEIALNRDGKQAAKRNRIRGWIAFVERIARPSLADRALPGSDAEDLGLLTPGG